MATVNRADLVRVLSDRTGCSQTEARKAVDALFEGLIEAMIRGARIEIRGFGSWVVKETNAWPRARNPRTGEEVFVPAHRKVAFKPGKLIRQALSQPLEALQTGTGT